MKIFKSIKWRLQLWYGLILVVVLAGFGFTAYQLERGRLLSRIDDELHRRLGILANALHRPPPHRPDAGEPPLDRPLSGPMPDDLPGRNQRPPTEFHLPPQAADLFSTNQPNDFYFVIESRDGKEIAKAGNVPTHEVAARVGNDLVKANYDRGPGLQEPKPPPAWTENGFREISDRIPSGETILVGHAIAPELKELHHTALNLFAIGGLILLVGLAGGWWLVSRAMGPIDEIGATAVKISAGDLSQRINVAEAESELGQLASVLNSTFARLAAAFAQQQQFTSDAAHELRTPVSVMLTQTQTALNRERGAAEYRETLEACQRAAQRMRKLIESLLELARLDAGQETLKRLRFDLSKTANDCVELVRPLANERGVNILSKLAPLEITGDSERLIQVVTNLLTNAIQYNHAGGEVRLKLESQSGMAVLTVADTGRGISIEDLPHVFKRFYRGDKSRTASDGNAGLGLAISKAIVEAHGGTIEVSSRLGVGTTFTIRLPA
ncbi:MAG: ATP-binding protein [Verrucomicrobiota bacterium]|jgi:heavy metal sensor kinase